jgi:hypothetical protein
MTKAITNGTTHQNEITAISGISVKIDFPSIIKARNASITGVSGNNLISGCTISGNRS